MELKKKDDAMKKNTRNFWESFGIGGIIGSVLVMLLVLFCGCERTPEQWAPVGTLVQYGPDGATQATVRMNPQLRQPEAKDFAQGEKARMVALVGHCEILNPQGASVALVRMNPQLGEPKPPPPSPGFWSGVLGFLCDPTTIATAAGLIFGGGAAAVPLFARLGSVLRGADEVVAYAQNAAQAQPEAIEDVKVQAQTRQEENGTLPVVRQLIGKEGPARLDVWAGRISGLLGVVSDCLSRKK